MTDVNQVFTPEAIESLREAFKAIDTSGDGYVSESEFDKFASENNIDPIIRNCIFLYFDNPEKGITFDQFLQFLAENDDIETNVVKFAKIIFDKIDSDGNGYLDREEFVDFVRRFNLPSSKESVVALLNKIDADGNGRITFDELCDIFGE